MLRRLEATAVSALMQLGELLLVDLRAPAEFARSHPGGALSLPFSERGLAERLEAVAPIDSRLVLLAPNRATEDAAAAQLSAGRHDVVGVVEGGFAGWRAAELPEAVLEEISLERLERFVASGSATILDVREPIEWSTGHVPGALLISLTELRGELDRVPAGQIVVVCEAGVRSCVAASLLLAAGRKDVAHLPEGSSGYRRAGLRLAFPSSEAGTR